MMNLEILEVFGGGVVLIIAFILSFLPLCSLFLFKSIVILIAACFKKDLTPLESSDCLMTPGDSFKVNGPNVGWVLQLDGSLTLDKVRELFVTKFCDDEFNPRPEYFRLQSCIVEFMGYAFFKKVSNFKLNRIIYEIHVEEEEGLEEAMSHFVQQGFVKDQPCWEMILVQQGRAGKSCLAFKIHHGLADAYSMRHILDCLTGRKSPYIVKEWEESAWQNAAQVVKAFPRLTEIKWDTRKDQLGYISSNNSSFFKIGFGQLDLGKMKRVRRRHNVQFVSVFLSVVSSAISRHVKRKATISDNEKNLIGMAFALPLPGHPVSVGNTLCNHMAMGFLGASVDEKASHVDRLLDLDKKLKRHCRLGLHKAAHWIARPCIALLPIRLLWWGANKAYKFPVIASMMIADDKYQFLGRGVERAHGIGSLGNYVTNLQFCVTSVTHSGKCETVVQALRHFKDQDELRDFMDRVLPQELDDLDKEGEMKDPQIIVPVESVIQK